MKTYTVEKAVRKLKTSPLNNGDQQMTAISYAKATMDGYSGSIRSFINNVIPADKYVNASSELGMLTLAKNIVVQFGKAKDVLHIQEINTDLIKYYGN